MATERWVINASPIILLAKVGLIPRVPQLVAQLVIPQPVVSEILSARKQDAAVTWFRQNGNPFVQPAVAELKELSHSEIGPGERSVISWAMAHPGFMAVLDDLEARTIAQKLGVKVIGTVGVILRLKKAGLISEVRPCLEEIRKVGGFIGDNLFHAALQQAGE